jgi:adenosylcobyric acid synthase
MSRAIMFQGTGSSVGKSLIVAGLARACRRRGIAVWPFKPQNMSNNAAVTMEGGEIGRAQALQARAAGVRPSVHMNPVLLKPQSETGAQIVVQGRVRGNAKARDYQQMKPLLLPAVLESFAHASAQADLVLVEGAGSASEINLRAGDIANMGFARAAGVPVIVIGDIDRGGVIASLVGTRMVIDPDDTACVVGFIVNRMRGDFSLFAEGMRAIAERTGWPALGLLPFFADAHLLPAEDAGLQNRSARAALHRQFRRFRSAGGRTRRGYSFAAGRTPDPRQLRPGGAAGIEGNHRRPRRPAGLWVGYRPAGASAAGRANSGHMRWLPDARPQHRRSPGHRGAARPRRRLGPAESGHRAFRRKTPRRVPVRGYEMHMGRTGGPDAARPLFTLADGRTDGARSADGLVAGTYLHGIFADDLQRARWLGGPVSPDYEARVEAVLDNLAAHLETHLDIDRIIASAR